MSQKNVKNTQPRVKKKTVGIKMKYPYMKNKLVSKYCKSTSDELAVKNITFKQEMDIRCSPVAQSHCIILL